MNRISIQEISENGGVLLDGEYSIFSKSLRPNQIASEETAKRIYSDVRIVGNDVYCLYMNQTWDEINNVPQPVEIHLFDEHLNPKTRYLIYEHIRLFAVDNINKTIYGVTIDEEYYRYRLP
jgi:hypothetical protein